MSTLFSPRHPRDIADLVDAHPLAWIVTGHAGALGATPLPVQVDCDEAGRPVRLVGHFARRNPQVEALRADPRATVLVIGPQGAISPSWFRDRSRAPTWNYASAVFEVEVELRDTRADADALLERLVAQVETGNPTPWRIDEVGARYEQLVTGVVGFHAHVREARATFKLGQDERDDVFHDILRALDIRGDADLAGWMRRFGEGRAGDAQAAPLPAPATPDPQIMQFIDGVRAEWARLAGDRVLDWPQRRELAEQTRAPWRQGGPDIADVRELHVDSDAGRLRLRVYDPAPGQAKPTLVYLHGGGWAMFSLDTHDRVMREYAARSGLAVVGLDYALAPEAPYPRALDQVVALARWLRRHGATQGLDGERLALGGDSAGGSLSFGAALRLRDAGEPDVVKAVLCLYGGFTPDCSPAALQRYGGPDDMLTGQEVRAFWNLYIGHERDKRDPYLSPLLADLRGLPPAFIQSGECDVVTEQNLQMAGHLLAAGVDVRAKVYPGAPHSFIEAVAVSSIAREAVDDGARWLVARLGGTADSAGV
ncbi:alpha/beta hydrolase fold domain-containing protein [Luteimonas sp. SDU82]|uniref:alpha/beta hydrolase fold domain-containing protein n=1 Tax=Luteimonas sp. SDU82 TaxID=3422592 RepID=UPI003EBBF164